MDVILLDNVGSLGVLGDRIDVKPGYGRNFLIPQGKAVPATQENIEKFEARRAELEAMVAAAQEAAQKRAQAIEALEQLQIAATAGEEGKLFGSVGVRELEEAIAAAGGDINKSEINMPEGPLRFVGEFSVECQLHVDVIQNFTVIIEAE